MIRKTNNITLKNFIKQLKELEKKYVEFKKTKSDSNSTLTWLEQRHLRLEVSRKNYINDNSISVRAYNKTKQSLFFSNNQIGKLSSEIMKIIKQAVLNGQYDDFSDIKDDISNVDDSEILSFVVEKLQEECPFLIISVSDDVLNDTIAKLIESRQLEIESFISNHYEQKQPMSIT